MSQIFTLPLRKTYAIIRDENLTELEGSSDDYLKILVSLSDKQLGEIFKYDLFLNSTDILSVLTENLPLYLNSTITIVSADLFNIYLNNKKFLNQNELTDLNKYVKTDLPEFENIVDYEKLVEYTESKNIEENLKTPIYRLTTSINPYNVLHISVPEFMKLNNMKKSILIRLRNTRMLVSLEYETYDLYNLATGTISFL